MNAFTLKLKPWVYLKSCVKIAGHYKTVGKKSCISCRKLWNGKTRIILLQSFGYLSDHYQTSKLYCLGSLNLLCEVFKDRCAELFEMQADKKYPSLYYLFAWCFGHMTLWCHSWIQYVDDTLILSFKCCIGTTVDFQENHQTMVIFYVCCLCAQPMPVSI